MHYHVRVSVTDQQHDEVKTDLTAEELDQQFLAPYREGRPITVLGKTIQLADVQRIRVSSSDEPASQLIEEIKALDRTSSIVRMGGPGYSWRAAARAQDVTDQFITGPPGEGGSLRGAENEPVPSVAPEDGPGLKVFVVAGRDNELIDAVVAFLRALGLQVVEWEHAVAKTGLPNPYIGDVVDAGLKMAQAAVVLLTPDDLVQLRPDLVRDKDGPDERELRGQARPNVYYEAGIADAIGRGRTVLVEIGPIKSFSDVSGRHVVRYDGSPAMRNAFAERLRVAGLDVNTTGSSWLQVGEIDPIIGDHTTGPMPSVASSVVTASKESVVVSIDSIVDDYETEKRRSDYIDMSDLPDETLSLIMRAQALITSAVPSSTYTSEAERVADQAPHIRLPVLIAILRAVRTEMT